MNRRGFGAALLVLSLVIGFEAGVLAERKLFSGDGEVATSEMPFRTGARAEFERGPARFAARLSAILSLSEEQERSIELLLTQHNDEVTVLLDGLKPAITARVDSVTEEIRTLLDAEQQEAFEAMLQDDRNRFRQRMESGLVGRGPGGRGPGVRPGR